MKILYRARQFYSAWKVKPAPELMKQVQALLTGQRMALFLRLQPNEQAHSLDIWRKLVEAGEIDADLLIAALLHDIGKSCAPLNPWERVIIVLAKALYPQGAKKWGRESSPILGWKKPFIVSEHHPAWGADLASEAGVSPTVEYLIRHHQDPSPISPSSTTEFLLCKLQAVDNQS